MVMELGAFFNSSTHPHVNRVLRNQLAGDVLNLVAILCAARVIFPPWLAHPATDSPVSASRDLEGV